jgi:hypothetical protein
VIPLFIDPVRPSCRTSLPRQRELITLLGADQVIDVLGRGVDVDAYPMDAAGEPIVEPVTVLLGYWLAMVNSMRTWCVPAGSVEVAPMVVC